MVLPVAVGLLVVALSTPGGLEAQRPHFLAFRGDMGMEVPHGDPDRLFQGNIRGEFSVLATPSWLYPVHLAAGFSWVSFPMEPDYPQEQWNYVGSHFALGATFQRWLPIPLYAEARVIERRLRPMEERDRPRYGSENDPATPFPEYRGWTLEGVLGLELHMGQRTFMDIAGRFADFAPEGVYLEEMDEQLGSGWTFGLQLGLVWFP